MFLKEVVGSIWFNKEVKRKVGNASRTSFWKDNWVENTPLQVLFLKCFSISSQKEAK